jgi:hypothetical protein
MEIVEFFRTFKLEEKFSMKTKKEKQNSCDCCCYSAVAMETPCDVFNELQARFSMFLAATHVKKRKQLRLKFVTNIGRVQKGWRGKKSMV